MPAFNISSISEISKYHLKAQKQLKYFQISMFFFPFLFFVFIKSDPKQPVSVPFISLSQEDYESRRDNANPNSILVFAHINPFSDSNSSIFIDIFQSAAEIASAFSPNTFEFGIVNNQNLKEIKLTIYYPGISEEAFAPDISMVPAQLSTFILSNSRQLLKRLQRLNKAHKAPEIARIKGELRQIRKLLKNSTGLSSSEKRTLIKDRNKLEEDLISLVPANKSQIRRLSLQLRDATSEKEKVMKKRK